MNEFWQELLKQLGGLAILSAALVWLTKSIITHFLTKDVEQHKNRLAFESSRETEVQKHLRALKSDAYGAYLQTVGEMSLQPGDIETKAKAIFAKAKVCFYGSAEVVDAIARFEDSNGIAFTPEKRKLFVDFINKMRLDVGDAKGELASSSIETILLGPPRSKELLPQAERKV